MLNKIYDWVDERLDITPIWRDIADHEVPEHVNPHITSLHSFIVLEDLPFRYCNSNFIWNVFDDVLCA